MNQFRFNFILSFTLGPLSVSLHRAPPRFIYRSRSFRFGPFSIIRFYEATIPILYKREYIGGKLITRDEAERGLPSDAECEATRAEFKLKRKPHWVIPIFFKKK